MTNKKPKKIRPNNKKNGFRAGVTKEDILQLTNAEKDQIIKQREFDNIKRDSYSYKVALQCDDLRRTRDKSFMSITKSMLGVKNARLEVDRMQDQLDTGNITREIKDGVTMTEHEIMVEIETAKGLIEAIIKDIPSELGRLRTIVGFTDRVKNVVMTEVEYDNYVQKVETDLKHYGYDLFDKNI